MYNYFVFSKYGGWLLLFFFIALNLTFFYRLIFLRKADGSTDVYVTRVIDGNSFVAGLRQYKLAGIITPEYPFSCLSTAAKDRLSNLILNKKVILKKPNNDKFGLTYAYVFLNDLFIDKALLSEGLGKSTNTISPYQSELRQAETDARSSQQGIWGGRCIPLTDCNIKGSFNSINKSYEYHLPNCTDYQKIEINFQNGDRWFCSESDAVKAQFKKSADCP